MRRPLLLALSTGAILAPALPARGALLVEVVEPAEGATVRGPVTVRAVGDATVLSMAFAWSSDGGASWSDIPTADAAGPEWTTIWDTGTFNGQALVRATGTDGVTSASDVVGVVVDNVLAGFHLAQDPPAFSPNADGRKDVTEIRATVAEPAELTVEVLDASGASRRTWTMPGAGAGTHTIAWDGRDGAGAPLPDGPYTVRVRGIDAAGNAEVLEAAGRLDTVAPVARLKAIRPARPAGRKPVAFRIDTVDAGALDAALQVIDRAGEVVAKGDFEIHAGEDEIRWRPATPKNKPLYPGTYVARLVVTDDAGNVAAPSEKAWRVLRRARAHVYRRVDGAGKRVAITIDDCHYRGAWASMLSTMRRMKVRATFFCPGDRMVLLPGLARRTARLGHQIGSHGWDHAALAGRGFDATARRLRRDEATTWRLTRTSSAPYFRPPYGSYDRAVLAAAGATGHPRVMMWDVETGDTGRPGPSAIAHRAVSAARRGSVILMHTIDQTAGALPAIIRGLRNKGLRPVTLAELFRAAGKPA